MKRVSTKKRTSSKPVVMRSAKAGGLQTLVTFGGESPIDDILTEIVGPASIDLRKDDVLVLYDKRLDDYFDSRKPGEYRECPPLYVDQVAYWFDKHNKCVRREIDLKD